MAILELEEGRKKALAELISYKATAKQLDADVEKFRAKATEWERRAMVAIRAGDDEAAKTALREKKAAEVEAAKIEHDKHEAASYAIQLNRSRKDFETKLQLKLPVSRSGSRKSPPHREHAGFATRPTSFPAPRWTWPSRSTATSTPSGR